jgi:hypothetical protein
MNRRSTGFTRIAMASALVTALAAAPALAVDGVLEINQACVAAGCFPGDGPGFPVEITIPGSYRLTSNLTVPDDDTTAILLQGVRLVNLDLNGFSIRGQHACGIGLPPNCPGGPARGIDVAVQGAVHIRVRNGGISNFGGGGIRLTDGSVIEELIVTSTGGDGIVAGGFSIVRDNVVTLHLGDGIHTAPSSGSLITGNVVRGVDGDGIEGGNDMLLNNRIIAAGEEDARLGNNAGYGHNTFEQAPLGGHSMGDNVCVGGLC